MALIGGKRRARGLARTPEGVDKAFQRDGFILFVTDRGEGVELKGKRKGGGKSKEHWELKLFAG